jgi:CRISPR-associated endonuclease/helicase Cas3
MNYLFPDIKESSPLQLHAEQCQISHSPQLFIIEDVTGAGKTEAALTLANRLMKEELGDGVFFALPTMATSDAMYGRMSKVYKKLFQQGTMPSLILAHSGTNLSADFRTSIIEPTSRKYKQEYGKDEETGEAQCNAWFADSRKKAFLADVGVGTVDQALLGVLPAKYQSLRLLGLFRKILIVDEVHAYDSYMHKLLQILLSFHSGLGGSAILLSATLPQKMKKELVESFYVGAGAFLTSIEYPLVTHVGAGIKQLETHVETRVDLKRHVNAELIYDEQDVFSFVEEKSNEGKCVCWIRNTVDDTIDAWQKLKTALGENHVLLFHARFAMADRLKIEKKVLEIFGYNNKPEDRKGKVLVATQVAEQSLDIDFDEMVTDLAPIDRIIQRAGRLHRHSYRGERGTPCIHVLTPEPVDDVKSDWFTKMFSKTGKVYPNHAELWLTAKKLLDKGGWNQPKDVRDMIEYVFDGKQPHPEALIKSDDNARAEQMDKRDLAWFNGLKFNEGYVDTPNQWRDDGKTPTRLGEITNSIRLAVWDGEKLTPWAGNVRNSWELSEVKVHEWRIKERCTLNNSVLEKTIEEVIENMPDKCKWSVLIPLIQGKNGVWQGEALNKKGETTYFSYSSLTGLNFTNKEAELGGDI